MIYVAIRVKELPMPHVKSVKRKCIDCKEKVWVDKRLADHAQACREIICMQCLMERE